MQSGQGNRVFPFSGGAGPGRAAARSPHPSWLVEVSYTDVPQNLIYHDRAHVTPECGANAISEASGVHKWACRSVR